MLRRIFQAKSSARKFSEGGGIFNENQIVRKKFYEGGVFYVVETYHGGVSRDGRKFVMEGQPDLLVLFENRSEIK